MKVTPRPDIAAKVVGQAAKRHAEPRESGIHLSALLVCLARSYFDEVVGIPKGAEPKENLRTMLGSAFHAWLQIEPEEHKFYDGRWHSTDALDEDAGDLIPIEIKSTRYSSGKGLVDYHVDQLAGYCISRQVNRGRLWVLYMFGNYRDQRDPQFICVDVEFSERELDYWRAELARRQDILQDAIYRGSPPPIEERLGWACKDCCYRGLTCPGGTPSTAKWGANFVDSTGATNYAQGI